MRMTHQILNEWLSRSSLYSEIKFKVHNLDRLVYLILDSMLGILTVCNFSSFNINLSITIWDFLHFSIEQLELLIIWLTQNPAGLKLNNAMNTFLSNFFLYHIHLWKTYITVLQHSFTNWFLIGSGLSLLIAFISDFLRLITIHIFCFYIYTHRLTKICWKAFLSFGRAFRGKKWNPLRQRIDSIQLDTKELFIATLFFIILLFLLPTIGVYYAVFGIIWKLVDFVCLGLNLWIVPSAPNILVCNTIISTSFGRKIVSYNIFGFTESFLSGIGRFTACAAILHNTVQHVPA